MSSPTAAAPAPRRRRARTVSRAALRAWFGVVGRVAPRFAERQAATLFLTPARRPVREPVVPGLVARRVAFDADGHRLAGWIWGDGPVVLLLHGWSGRAADLSTIAGGVAAAGFRAVAVDMPAHGATGGRTTSLMEWTRVLVALAPRLAPDGLHAVVAHSFGAAATTLALEAGLRARGAVLLAPARGPEHFIERMRHVIGLPSARAAGLRRRLVERVGRELAYFDAARAAAELYLPALVVHDPADDEVPWSHAEAIAGAWRDSRLVAAPGAGHHRLPHAPDVVRRTLDFVRALPAGAAAA